MNAAILSVCLALLFPQSDVKSVQNVELGTPKLVQMLNQIGVADPENIADYVPLFPQNSVDVTTVRGDTEITVHASDGQSYVISNMCLTLRRDEILVRAVVEGWDVEGVLEWYDDNQVKLSYQFQVPMDLYEAPPTTMVFDIGSSHNWLPTPSGRGGHDPQRPICTVRFATECKCVGRGNGDGPCTRANCENVDKCGDNKECLDGQVTGSASLLGFALPAILLMMAYRRRMTVR